MIPKPVPTPERVRAYLASHGWAPHQLEEGEVKFVYRRPDDDGEPITVFVPGSEDVLAYPLRISDVVDTLTWVEDRPKGAIWADLCETAAPRAPTVPVTPTADAPADPVTS